MISLSKQRRLIQSADKKIKKRRYTVSLRLPASGVTRDSFTQEATSAESFTTVEPYCAWVTEIGDKVRKEQGIDQQITALMYISRAEFLRLSIEYPLDSEARSVVDENSVVYKIKKVIYEGEYNNTFIVATLHLQSVGHRAH